MGDLRDDAVNQFVCLYHVCLFVCRLKCEKTRFSQKLSNSELWSQLTTNRKSWAFQRTHYWTPRMTLSDSKPRPVLHSEPS